MLSSVCNVKSPEPKLKTKQLEPIMARGAISSGVTFNNNKNIAKSL